MLNGSIEENTLTALVWHQTLAAELIERVSFGDFSTDIYRKIAKAAVEFYQRRGEPAGVHISDMLEQEIKSGNDGRFLQEVIGEMEG